MSKPPTPVSALIHAATLVILLPLKKREFFLRNSLYAGKTFNRFYVYFIDVINFNNVKYKKILGVCKFALTTVNQQVILKIEGTRSTSETTRELSLNTFNFENYKKEYNLNADTKFLEWFIGFSEGEASFILAKRGDLSFVVTQSTTDINSLNYIKDNLGFGKIIKQSIKDNTHRFVIQDIQNLYLICLLFNGNMVFPTRKAKFLIFLSYFNEKLLKKNLITITPLDICVTPSLKDG